MQTYLPDSTTRERWSVDARLKRSDPFWRSLPTLPARPVDGHKGTFGTALAVGGSRGMSGAIALTGSAALVAGAGLTRLFVPDPILETVASFQREYTTIPGAADASGRLAFGSKEAILRSADSATAVAVGPGIGRSDELTRLVVDLYFELERPAIFDADALNALAEAGVFNGGSSTTANAPRVPRGPRILTPHPGEFARLTGVKPPKDRDGRVAAAVEFARRIDDRNVAAGGKTGEFVVVLKGAGTVVSDGRAVSVDITRNPNLATGGSGDVLTGITLGLAAQGAAPFDAAISAVVLHGLAADLRSNLCSRGGIASDVVRFLPSALEYYQTARN